MPVMVLDASAAAMVALQTPGCEVFEEAISGNVEVVSSQLLEVEIRNVFWKYVHVGAMTVQEALARIDCALDLVDLFIPIGDNAAESFSEAVRSDHSVDDMLYLTIARRVGATLLTADKRLARLCDELGVRCRS